MPLSFNDAVNLITDLYNRGDRTSSLLLGPPGTGKTSVCREVAQKLRAQVPDEPFHYVEMDLTGRNPEDIQGMADKSADGTSLVFLPPAEIHQLTGKVRGVLVLDDIGAADTRTATKAREIVLDRRVGLSRLSDDVLVLLTSNRKSDKAGANVLPSHLLNAVRVLRPTLTLREWTAYYAQQRINGQPLTPIIPGFLVHNTADFSQLPSAADAEGSFATPRAWMNAARDLTRLGTADLRHEHTVPGFVGAKVGANFVAYASIYAQLPAPEILVREGQDLLKARALLTGLPDSNGSDGSIRIDTNNPAKFYALVTSLVGHAVTEDPCGRDVQFCERVARALVNYISGKNELLSVSINLAAMLSPVTGPSQSNPVLKGFMGLRAVDENMRNIVRQFAEDMRGGVA